MVRGAGLASTVWRFRSARAQAAGLSTRLSDVSAVSVAQLAGAPALSLVVFVSTAGQGEFPPSALSLWEALQSGGCPALAGVRFTVFALGDSNYWGDEKKYFCMSGMAVRGRPARAVCRGASIGACVTASSNSVRAPRRSWMLGCACCAAAGSLRRSGWATTRRRMAGRARTSSGSRALSRR